MQNTQLFTSGAIVSRKRTNGKWVWLLTKNESGEWEFPKTMVRKGESSVRAVLRTITEQGGMNARIIEEAGDYSSTATINGKSMPKRLVYYVLFQKSSGEIIGLNSPKWFEYTDAIKKLESKREQQSLKIAREQIKIWEEKKKKNPDPIEL